MVVATSTSASSRINFSITLSSSFSPIWPWPTTTRAFGTSFGDQRRQRVDGLDAVVNEIDLTVAGHFVFDRAANQFFLEWGDHGLNRQAVARRSFDH